MPASFTVAVFEGDGIGPEVMSPTLAILRRLADASPDYGLEFTTLPGGAGCFRDTGEALPTGSLAAAGAADAILLSAMGLPGIRYPDGTEITPQIDLRMEFDLYAGVRPVRTVPGQASPLAGADRHPIDFVLIRESTEGLFHSQGRGEVHPDAAFETLKITRRTCEKLFRFTFDLAEQRRASGAGKGRVTCIDKANVFRAFTFFRNIFDAEAAHHPDLRADHAYVDAMALWMVQRPWDYDVMVTENMFGDILSDLGAGLMGGLGMAPSADIGDDHAVFQPCHGTAPDIMGQGLANPVAMIRSGAMMLDWLGRRHDMAAMIGDAARLDRAADAVISSGNVLTADLGGRASTEEVAAAVARVLVA